MLISTQISIQISSNNSNVIMVCRGDEADRRHAVMSLVIHIRYTHTVRTKLHYGVCVRVCVVILFILDVWIVDVPAGVTQEERHTGFLHLPSAVLALIFLTRRIQPFLSLVDREVELCVLIFNE